MLKSHSFLWKTERTQVPMKTKFMNKTQTHIACYNRKCKNAALLLISKGAKINTPFASEPSTLSTCICPPVYVHKVYAHKHNVGKCINHRIIESLRLEKTSKIINFNHQPITTMPEVPYLNVF